MKKLLAMVLLLGTLLSPMAMVRAMDNDNTMLMNSLIKLARGYINQRAEAKSAQERNAQYKRMAVAYRILGELDEMQKSGNYTENDLDPFVHTILELYRPL